MATTERDYYELLEVARSADEQEIKRAFRRKARELHPDVSDAPDAEQRFRELVEAYEVLSKADTRALYDRYGHAGLRTGGYRPAHFDFGDIADLFSAFFGDDLFGVTRPRRRRGGDIAAEVEIDLVEAAHGVTREIGFPVAVVCETCGGSGAKPGTAPVECSVCHGSGRLQQVRETAFGQFVQTQVCPRCQGTGRVVEHPCRDCGGEGRQVGERTLDVEIPAGIDDGQRLRITGEGHAGLTGGAAGDIYVRVRVKRDPRFSREGNDVVSRLDLTMTEAVLGATVQVPTLDGDIELELPPGTQPGEIRVLRGRGMPVLQGFGRGDHRIVVNVRIPRRLTAEQRALLEEFERKAGEDNYNEDEGFFERLRSAFR